MLVFFLMISQVSLAAPASCPKDDTDSFAVAMQVPAGPYKEKCIDPNYYRSVRSVSPTELASLGLKDDGKHLYVANFRHNNSFWLRISHLFEDDGDGLGVKAGPLHQRLRLGKVVGVNGVEKIVDFINGR